MKQKQRFTSMSRTKFHELISEITNGNLIKEWPEEREPKTKKEKVLARQLQAIAIISKDASNFQTKVLISENWTELHILFDNENFYLEICGVDKLKL